MPTENKVIKTIEEWEKAINEAKRDGESMEEQTVTVDITLSPAEATKLFERAKKNGIPMTGTPPSSTKKPRKTGHRHRP